MPKIVKTVRSLDARKSGKDAYINAVEAISSALGSSYTRVDDGSDNTLMEHFIPTESIGYPGFCLYLRITGANSSEQVHMIKIVKMTSSNEPDLSDTNAIDNAGTVNDAYFMTYSPVTCVVFKDSSNDTVCFSVHNGETENEAAPADKFLNYTFQGFLAKDVNEDVLCGVGNTHIHQIRTKNNRLLINPTYIKAESYGGALNNCLHVTKMVNYLSPEYSEMKSAYVAITRPEPASGDNGFNKAYYSDGARWGFAGLYRAECSSGDKASLMKAISPIVKY